MAIAAVTEASFPSEVLMQEGLVVVDYWANWCAPCKQLSPILKELDEQYEQVKFVKVDTNAEPGLAAQQGVMSLPTLQFFIGGRIAKSLTGGKTKKALQKVIDELI